MLDRPRLSSWRSDLGPYRTRSSMLEGINNPRLSSSSSPGPYSTRSSMLEGINNPRLSSSSSPGPCSTHSSMLEGINSPRLSSSTSSCCLDPLPKSSTLTVWTPIIRKAVVQC